MAKVCIIGAGSLVFTRHLMTDILSFPALQDTHFTLMDIDKKRLGYSERVARRLFQQGGYKKASLETTTNRQKALKGADFVIISILHGGIEVISQDIDIPLKYGVDQCIGDTLGPGGVFRALRTIPVMVEIYRDIERICPQAWVLQYTNPMAMLCLASYETARINLVGLCHSVQGTAWQWATRIGATTSPIAGEHGSDIDYWCAGINHQAWFLQFRWKGQDAYPLIRKAAQRPEVYREDTTRCEMLRHLGYAVTESSGHNSEYNPWFRKRPELIERYCPGGSWNGGTGFIKTLYGTDREHWEEEMERAASGKEPLDLRRSGEYGAFIIHSILTGEALRINGNVRNTGLITNLPEGCCVEVPCLVDRQGVHPCHVGALPPQLAALNQTNVNVQMMAVRAALTGDRQMAFWSIAHDPLTAAVLSLDEIQAMVDEMFEAEAKWLPQFKPVRGAKAKKAAKSASPAKSRRAGAK